ncbi:hypothetical protein CYMTET_16623 [Cymbomonas tetramitiformis]|uniref:Uncharacterized protein n=1 Tax=Cymbomonas tetramitiformis TaxID=36881 RepID=A0AAE0GC48_9CHLO|nr:hypothetical protein CYMTET_16623 [Cymbomonas tetramitiformis]
MRILVRVILGQVHSGQVTTIRILARLLLGQSVTLPGSLPIRILPGTDAAGRRSGEEVAAVGEHRGAARQEQDIEDGDDVDEKQHLEELEQMAVLDDLLMRLKQVEQVWNELGKSSHNSCENPATGEVLTVRAE